MSGGPAFADGDVPEYDASVKEYHFSRARYIRAVTSDTEKKLLESVAKRREPLQEEIANLTALARVRYDTRQEAVKAYAARAPGKVKPTGLVPPSTAERFSGVDKVYRAALKAAEEFNEVNDIIKKKKVKLEKLEEEVRVVLEQHERDLIAQLETPVGLEGAFKRDPLLGRAYARMQAAGARRAAIVQSMKPLDAPGNDG